MTMTKNEDPSAGDAGAVRREFIDDTLLDELLASTSQRGLALTGEGGLLPVKCPGFDGDIEHLEGQSVHGSTT